MATLTLEDRLAENLGTISPADLEVLDIFVCDQRQCVNKDKPTPNLNYAQKTLDQELIDATMTVLKTGKLTPLIKQELKCTIQNRRLARGQEELDVDMSPPTPTQPMSPEEEASLDKKRQTRRERNRIAALKCRRKKRQEMSELVQQCETLEKKNAQLKTTLADMEHERNLVLQALSEVQSLQIDVGGAAWTELVGGASFSP